MILLAYLYNGLVLGLLFSILAFQNQWLEMRINVGIIAFVTIVISMIIYTIALIKNKPINKKRLVIFTFSSLFSSITITFVILGVKRITTLPASILREALGITKISFENINIIILSIIILGIVTILAAKAD